MMDETGEAVGGAEHKSRSRGGLGQSLQHLLALAKLDPGLAALVVMAVVGIGVSCYLTLVHYDTKIPLVCPTSGHINCAAVTSSQWSLVPFTPIPITFPGILWFGVSGGLAIALLRAVARGEPESARVRRWQLAWSALGALTVLYLVFVEIVQLHFTFCEWCTVVHLMTFASFVIVLDRVSRVPMVPVPTPAARISLRSGGGRTGGNGKTATTKPPSGGARAAQTSSVTRTTTATRATGARTAARPTVHAAQRPAQKARSKR
jgi:uncharacterized membrane protein